MTDKLVAIVEGLQDLRETLVRIGEGGFSEKTLIHSDEAAALALLIDASPGLARDNIALTELVGKMREALEEASDVLQQFRGIQTGHGWDAEIALLDEAQGTIRAVLKLSDTIEGGV